MSKTGLKTFVYSFSVSLFAIFAANGVYWHNHSSERSDVKIPSKNVMLFLKTEPVSPSNLSVPVKKIALNVLPELKDKSSAAGAPPEDEIIMADNLEMLDIPLEIELMGADEPEVFRPVMVAENAAPRPKAPVRSNVSKPNKVKIPLQVPEAAIPDEPVKSEAAPKTLTPPALAMAETKLALTRNTTSAEAKSPPAAKTKQTLPAVEPKPALLIAEAQEPLPLLPLERSGDVLAQSQAKVKIGNPQNLNQVALADKKIPIHSMENAPVKNAEKLELPAPPSWESMAEKTPEPDSPWLVAKADGALKNQKVASENYYRQESAAIKQALQPQPQSGTGVQVAAETVKNLLIPIPEDILNDENLMPQLSVSSDDKKKTEKTAAANTMAGEMKTAVQNPTENTAAEAEPEKVESQKNKLLSSLNSIFKSNTSIKKEDPRTAGDGDILANIRQKINKKSSAGKIMPTEMRLSFQPNRAEISGQTLRWIQAFAAKAAEDNSMAIEIRIDGTSAMDLQQKRLNLLHNILTNKGVEYSKINTVFTQREPNSFIIRTLTLNNNSRGNNGNMNKAANGYYQQW